MVPSVLTKGDQLGKGDYTINTSPDNDNCTFEITLNEDYVKSMADNASVTITYSATVIIHRNKWRNQWRIKHIFST